MANNKYDELIKESIEIKYLLDDDSVYFNEKYRDTLSKMMSDIEREAYNNELNMHWDNRYKMCSVASSSRLCYLMLKGKGYEFEYQIKNDKIEEDGCKPHYDAHKGNEFIECKCHELRKKPTSHLKYEPYHELLKRYFRIDCKSEPLEIKKDNGELEKIQIIKPKYSDFGIKFDSDKLSAINQNSDPTIYDLKFDFKQLICHILGLLTLNEKSTLKYYIFVPKQDLIDKSTNWIKKWNNEMRYLADTIISSIENCKAYLDNKEYNLNELIDFELNYICVSKIEDLVLKQLK